jgi:hypothetical protein
MIPEFDIDYDYDDYDRGFIDDVEDRISYIMDDLKEEEELP